MGKIYAHTHYRMRLLTKLDLTGAVSLTMEVWNPNEVSTILSATQDQDNLQKVYHDFTPAENNMDGEWRYQPIMTDANDKDTKGETYSMTIYKKGK